MAKSNFRRLEVLQNRVLRLITGAPWFVPNQQLRDDLGIPTLKTVMTGLAEKTLERIERSENPLITHLAALDPDRPPPRIAVRKALAIADYEIGP